MRRPAAAMVLALSLLPQSAAGDELEATRSQPLVEVSHSVDLRIEGGTAVYVVRRTFANPGARADEAHLNIDLPMGAAVTGLRIRARDRWYDAELLEAEEARKKYQTLTSLGAWDPKDPALLQWVWPDRMLLQVFPVLPSATSTVEYTLTAPLHYREGRYIVSYPRASNHSEGTLPLATPSIRIDPGHGDATTPVRIDGRPVAPNTPVVLSVPERARWIGDGEADPMAGYAWSALKIEQPGSVESARVSVDIDHTYRGDLRLSLVTPTGHHVALEELSGGDNDVHRSFDVALPKGTQASGQWHLMVADEAGLDIGTLDAWSLKLAAGEDPAAPGFREVPAKAVPVFIPDAPEDGRDEGLALIEIDAAPIKTLASRYGRVTVDDTTHFLRLEVESARELQALPKSASVVFVVDASRSTYDVMEQLTVARAYMDHVPDARAEVVLFRRFAERVTGEFLTPSALWTALDVANKDDRLALGNGSALEEGIRLAGKALRGRAGPRRIVVLTDARLRSRFVVEDGVEALRTAPKGSIAHIVVPGADEDETRLVRDDSHALAAIPASSGGVLFGINDQGDPKTLRKAALELVRPVAIDQFEVRGVDLATAPEVPTRMPEGSAYGFMIKSTEAPPRLRVQGKIWGRTFRRTIRANRRFGTATAAFVFSEDEHQSLTREQMMTVAMRGRAVSPVTSYLATEPGVRPSTIGLELVGTGSGGGGSGAGTIGLGSAGMLGHGRMPKAWTLAELIDDGLDACVAQHDPPNDWRVELNIESTFYEVVDVIPVSGDAAMRACLVEAAWELELTWNFKDERTTHALVLP